MLLPYLEKFKEKGEYVTLGQLKTALLKLLADNAGMHNLSLKSNYYLAGAARYYFNGDLTVDGNVGLLTGEPDNFNEEVCRRLNTLIVILRNAYIDTIGQTFEQPEDFGTLKLPALLKKYNAKINKELGLDVPKEKKEKVDTLDRTPNVGRGYSFDIIYSFPLGTKYERATAPGSWCVTYGQSHFNSYTKRSNPPSHLVVFRQDGWEGITRKDGLAHKDDMWVKDEYNRGCLPRPHDPYANSLIAFFQRNDSWEPANWCGAPLITSRWNHGSNDTGSLEADRAYSLEEFEKITGVSDGDLQRIFEIWKKDCPKSETKKSALTPEEKEKRLDFLRKIKYAQMCANGGESFENSLSGLKVVKFFTDNETFKKGVAYCMLDGNAFLIDKGQIVFDSIIYNAPESNCFYDKDSELGYTLIANSVIMETKGGQSNLYSVYNYRYHKMLELDGLTSFVSISNRKSYGDSASAPAVIEVTQRGKRSGLIDSKTGLPIKLPNGAYIFEYCKFDGSSWGVTANSSWACENDVIFIMYDSSSREAYTYSTSTKQFQVFDKENLNDITEIKYIHLRNYGGKITQMFVEGEYQQGWQASKLKRNYLFGPDGKQLSIFPGGAPYSRQTVVGIYGPYIGLDCNSQELRRLGIPRVDDRPVVLYNPATEDYLRNPEDNKVIHVRRLQSTKYPSGTLFLSQNWNETPTFIDISDGTTHTVPLPYARNINLNFRYEYSTEEYAVFILGMWGDFKRGVETLKDLDYALYIQNGDDIRWPKAFLFVDYDNLLSGVPTKNSNFDTYKATRNIQDHENQIVRMNESAIPIQVEDIYEMVQNACSIILENLKK